MGLVNQQNKLRLQGDLHADLLAVDRKVRVNDGFPVGDLCKILASFHVPVGYDCSRRRQAMIKSGIYY